MSNFPVPVELADADLDFVAAGAIVNGTIGGGLINVQVADVADIDTGNINVLNGNNVGVGVGVAAGVLGNAGALGVGRA